MHSFFRKKNMLYILLCANVLKHVLLCRVKDRFCKLLFTLYIEKWNIGFIKEGILFRFNVKHGIASFSLYRTVKRATVKCPVVAQTQGYHLVCLLGSLGKFQGGGVVLKTMFCARVDLLSFCTGLSPVFQSSMSPPNGERFVCGWASCCCTDTGLSSDMSLG